MSVSSLVMMEMTMWHLQVHQCEEQLQELEISSQQLLQASSEQVSSHCACFSGRTLCGIHFLHPLSHSLLHSLTHSLARHPPAHSLQ